MEAKVISRKNDDLTLQEAVNLLLNAARTPTKMVNFVPPVKPIAGDIFVYSPGENLHKVGEIPI